ncbi:MAG: hypothetical protein A3H28_09615 [Acidobacteria bacterium RIFCSPLOWO2_02_FULL_61_28]|nr:MAG: hypothetical protein A3H28_09615 [Acidobacteria bacterium RIFCSPLOWO2_02_FULL_61_28]
MERKKIIYLAAGPPSEAAADLRRLGLHNNGESLRVVVPAELAPQLESLVFLPRNLLWRYGLVSAPWLWLRLMAFLGFSGNADIIVFAPQGQWRFLKLLALALRGRVRFSDGDGMCVPFSLWKVLRRMVAARGPVCVIGSASPELLREILADVRARYPDAPLHGVLPSWYQGLILGLDSSEVVNKPGLALYRRLLRRCVGRGRFRRVVLPWTWENFAGFQWLGWFLPLGRVEIYNENLDAFSGRNLKRLLGHWLWRIRQRRERHRRTLPVGVIGSASAVYLRKIVAVLRAQYPGARLHALLPESLAGPAAGLFDSVGVLPRGFFPVWIQAWRFVRARNEFQCWIVPCTNEPYYRMKWLAFLLPLARRQIYNELADGFAVREPRKLYRHFCWRLRDHLSFQIVAGAAGRHWLSRLGHLFLYAARLLAGVSLLWRIRDRSAPGGRARRFPQAGKALPRVDVLVLGSSRDGDDLSRSVPSGETAGAVRVVRIPDGESWREVNAAIRSSDAEFICLLDPECRLSPADWLHRLLESFDDRTAQVGPELISPDGETLLRGLLLESSGTLVANADNAVRWHRRPECLEVDALPWTCLLVRRRVLLEVGYFSEDSGSIDSRADAEFCRRLAACGWRSLCNRSVTAMHPAVSHFSRAVFGEVTEVIRQ